jgi:predicted nucleic acid-binding protein
VIVADTGAILALLDADDRHHATLRALFERDRRAWLLPWAVLPEVDYLALTQLGRAVEQAFLDDVADGAFVIDWGVVRDLERARAGPPLPQASARARGYDRHGRGRAT